MTLKNLIKSRKLTFGSWITLREPAVVEMLSRAGFDWLVVDMEHSAITLDIAQDLIRVIELSGVAPLVRIGANDPIIIKRVMDAGAHGVIVPMVSSRSDAERAISSVYYPPRGRRSVGLTRAQGYGLGFQKYLDWQNQGPIVVVQIEHVDALENLEEILSVDGVDASIIGPYDLSGSIGFPGEFHRKKVADALSRYEKVCKGMEKPMGYHVVNPDPNEVKGYIKRGYTFIAIGIDTLYLGVKCNEVLRDVRR